MGCARRGYQGRGSAEGVLTPQLGDQKILPITTYSRCLLKIIIYEILMIGHLTVADLILSKSSLPIIHGHFATLLAIQKKLLLKLEIEISDFPTMLKTNCLRL